MTKLGSSLLAEGEAAEALVEARDLAALLDLARAADPCRMDLRIDLEVQRVAFLAPGRAGLELGTVGHLDGDHVVIGMGTGLHLIFPWLSRWFPTSSDKLSGASTGRGGKLQLRRPAGPALPSTAARCAGRARTRRIAAPRRRGRRRPCSGRTELQRHSRRPVRRRSPDISR